MTTQIINAALNGPEVKIVKINGHEFNVKPVSYRVNNGEITIFGQISHCLQFRADDQIWFTFRKKGHQVTPSDPGKMIIEKEDGGLLKTIGKLKDIGVFVGGFFGVGATKFFDLVESQSGNLSFLDFDGDWENALKPFLTELAKQAREPQTNAVAGLRLFQDDNLRGRSVDINAGKDIENITSMGWNDRASPFQASVPAGQKLQLFQHDNFRGLALELGPGRHTVRDLKIHRLGDAITSVRWENV